MVQLRPGTGRSMVPPALLLFSVDDWPVSNQELAEHPALRYGSAPLRRYLAKRHWIAAGTAWRRASGMDAKQFWVMQRAARTAFTDAEG
jgi:hypothetical protein